MELAEYENIYRLESKHFFYVSLHSAVLNLVKKNAMQPNSQVLDAGCGAGLLAHKMQTQLKFAKVRALDFHPKACELARSRGLDVTQGNVCKLPYDDAQFDVVTCIDVLYHQNVDDQQALQEIQRVLKPGGALIMRVPATTWLRSAHDRLVHTRERYDAAKVVRMLENSNFKIERLSHLGMFLLPFAVLQHWRERKVDTQHSSIQNVARPINALMKAVMYVELALLHFVTIPFGIGILAVGRKSR